jgi:predicted amidohydrolase
VAQTDAVLRRPDRNLAHAHRLISAAARRGARLLVFPEMYLTGYSVWPRVAAAALDGASAPLRALRAAARRARLAVVVGYPERSSRGVYNAACVIDGDGTLRGVYRKVHLFGNERRYFRAGRRWLVVRLPGLTIGVLICYDVEFPEAARILALKGVQLVTVLSANMEPYRASQDVYLRARALENQVFVALANRVGAEGATRFVGGSGIWGPGGETLVAAETDEQLLVASLDLRRLGQARRQFDYLAERRPDTYIQARPAAGRRVRGVAR